MVNRHRLQLITQYYYQIVFLKASLEVYSENHNRRPNFDIHRSIMQREQKQSRGNQLIRRRLMKTKCCISELTTTPLTTTVEPTIDPRLHGEEELLKAELNRFQRV